KIIESVNENGKGSIMKRNFVMLFSIVFIFSFITACSSNDEKSAKKESDVGVNKEGIPIVDEKLTMTMIAPGTAQSNAWEEMYVIQEIEQKMNIDYKINTPTVVDFGTNLDVALASGDNEDNIYDAETDDLTPAIEVNYGEQVILLPLDHVIDQYEPNLKKLLE